MKLHVLTIGKPKLHYASLGWNEYLRRLEHFYKIKVQHLSDKYAGDARKILEATRDTFRVALVITGGEAVCSRQLAMFLRRQQLSGRDLSFMIGGPDGLPQEVIAHADWRWNLSPLTFPHDLAMVITLEALYRASTINAGMPYHK